MGSVISGLFGGGAKPQVQQPRAIPAPSKNTNDPNQSSKVAEAHKRRVQLSKRTGRSALRVDLASKSTTTRSGVGIQS